MLKTILFFALTLSICPLDCVEIKVGKYAYLIEESLGDYKLNNLYLGRYSDAAVYAQGNVLIYFLVPKKVLDYDKLEVPERAVFPQGKVLASKDNPDDRYLSLHARLKSPDNELQLLITVRGDDTLTVSRAKETPLKALQSIVKHRDSFPRVKSGQPITPIN